MSKDLDDPLTNNSAGNVHRISREYALMRITHLVALPDSDLVLYSDEDLQFLCEEFHTAHLKVLLAATDEVERTKEFEVTTLFESRLRMIKSRLGTLRTPNKVFTKTEPPTATPNSNAEYAMARLPKISIQPFDGKLENWLSFIQLFNSLIHERNNLSNVEKLHYLLSSVQNEAHNLIKNFPLTNDNYMLAYNTLYKQYNKPRQLAATYYDHLINCESVKSTRPADLERVHRTFAENLSILNTFELPDKNFMLVQLLWSKLDRTTREQFELEHNSDAIPKFEKIQEFIEKRYRALEAANSHSAPSSGSLHSVVSPQQHSIMKPSSFVKKERPLQVLVAAATVCGMCSQSHDVSVCQNFLDLDPEARFNFVKEKKLCLVCFSSTHAVRTCRKPRCERCGYSHNVLLHFDRPAHDIKKADQTQQDTVLLSPNNNTQSLFSTVKVLVKNDSGDFIPIRALLDCASACNFMTEACAQKLGLKINRVQNSVNGIGQVVTEAIGSVSCEITPMDQTYNRKLSLSAFVLPTICPEMPTVPIDISSWHHTKDLIMADPFYDQPGPIDMLLSVDVFASSLLPGLRHGTPDQPTAINTVFGWILMGGYILNNRCRSQSSCNNKNCFFVAPNLALDDSIKRFWELENVSPPKQEILSKEDQKCEQYFVEEHHRTDEGRFVVPLPFVDPSSKPLFSNSRKIALKRFLSLEKKLQNNTEFSKNYSAFMQDYESSHHMEECAAPEEDIGPFYYIPHHGILRPLSTSTPLRVVFDASAKDAQGISLNDTLMTGQKLQTNIFDLLLRFRWHAVVFTADVKQMYRQILVPLEDAEFQRILWRFSPSEPVRDYKLLTVTYGVSSAPYQALRTMAQLAKDSKEEFPDGSAILDRDIYVDDVVSGTFNIDDAVKLRAELTHILLSGGFHLRKWTSNREEFCADLPPSDLYSEDFHQFENIGDVSLKILGLLWQPQTDCFMFKVALDERRCTKRSILSEIARIFDPLGLLSPVTFYAKYLMQLLWVSGISWDEDVPQQIADEWATFKTQLPSLSAVTIPRRMVTSSFVVLQFHGFCDASERGYCAMIFCRVINADQSCSVELCCAKSRVAPLRKLSVPRLELLAAVLLSDLMDSVKEALKPFYTVDHIFAWSDSSVTLSWIKSCPSKWKTFVANRVSHIQDIIPPNCWQHVGTADNPADAGSRGLLPADLLNHATWWKGPTWLSQPEHTWPKSLLQTEENIMWEEQRLVTLMAADHLSFVDGLLNRFSSLRTVKHVLAYCFRLFHNLKNKNNPEKKLLGALQPSELNQALLFLVKAVQEQIFSSELNKVKRSLVNSLPKTFRKLSPFVDEAGLLRVGGRLVRATVEFDVKHPLLLPRNHRLTSLVIDEYHKRFFHPGLQTLQNLLMQHFWILSPKRAIRSVISGCLKCFRAHPQPIPAPHMGNLPSYRINQIKPFASAAVDYGGPFDIALGRGRGVKTYKGYICVFVCTSTKAVHLELASELSTEAFLAVLRRFVARRGRCHRLVSDQGKNFVGASNYLQGIMKSATQAQEIEFKFNPPGSPHFSGLAEAGIKSVKTHLARVIGSQRLTFEEFYTLLTQIESLLNSRPLTPLSSDANDFAALSPGHFLTLEPLTIIADENLVDTRIGLLKRWKLLQKMHQDFWRKWHLEYIHTLQQRMKWNKNERNILAGTLVLIVNEQASPMHWKLGRIIECHPGSDGICRVVTVRTSSGQYKRPVVKLCPLPILD